MMAEATGNGRTGEDNTPGLALKSDGGSDQGPSC